MKPLIKLAILLIFCCIQDKPLVIKLNAKPEIYTTDKLGNSYVYSKNQLKKYSPKGVLIGQYSRLDLGKIHAVDASDPLQVMLFYKDFNQIVLLDSKLSALGKPLLLDEINLSDVSVVCKSKQQAIWIYDKYEHKLLQYRFYPWGIIQSINLDKFSSQIGDISFLLENGNELYLNQQNKAIWVFDQFGSTLHRIDIQTDKEFQVQSEKLVYHNQKNIFLFSLKSHQTDTINVDSFPVFDNARMQQDLLYLINNDSITIISLKKL